MLIGHLVFLAAAAVIVALGNCNDCPNKDDIKLYDKDNQSKFICWPLPKCNDGQEFSVQPGSSHLQGTKLLCIRCPEDHYSNNSTNKRCRKCTPCGNKKELSSCELSRDRQCSHSCISSELYFNATDQQCYPCTECCGASDKDIERQCISMRVGTVIGGNGEKHCKASFKSSQRCSSELPLKKTLSSSACGNSSLSSNYSLEARDCSCGNSSLPSKLNSETRECSFSMDGLHIALICILGVILVIAFLVGCRLYASRRKKQSSRSGYAMPPCVSTCAGQGCDLEMGSCTHCQEKLELIPEGMKIDNIDPYEVENFLIENLDAKRSYTKNWWDVGRMLGISVSELGKVKQEENREGGSPTKCLLGILSTWENVVSLRKFVETTHKLRRHDICNAIYEFYQSQGTTV